MGTTIVESNRLDASYNMVFYRPDRTVYVRAGLNPVTQTCTITYELGHTPYAHDCSTQQTEQKADEWAANHLLHEAAVQHTGYETKFKPAATATELGVTQHILKSWCRRYQAGSTTCRCSLRNLDPVTESLSKTYMRITA